jgi:hypothetical protein
MTAQADACLCAKDLKAKYSDFGSPRRMARDRSMDVNKRPSCSLKKA